jgi:hypothetical protein
MLHPVSNDHYFSYAFSFHSRNALVNQKCRLSSEALWSHCKPGISSLSHQQRWSLFNDHVQQDRRPASKIDVYV